MAYTPAYNQSGLTELDKFEPEGEPIHPYDLFELMNALPVQSVTILQDCGEVSSPKAVDEADYLRNRHKLGSVITIAGKKYFQTTTVPAKTKMVV